MVLCQTKRLQFQSSDRHHNEVIDGYDRDHLLDTELQAYVRHTVNDNVHLHFGSNIVVNSK